MTDHEQRVREWVNSPAAPKTLRFDLDALKAERDQLRADLAEARDYGDRWRAKANEDHEAREAAEAEVERLREALREREDELRVWAEVVKPRWEAAAMEDDTRREVLRAIVRGATFICPNCDDGQCLACFRATENLGAAAAQPTEGQEREP